MNAKEFLDSAYQINQDATKEVDYRNATSRAYYAAYHGCKKLVNEPAVMGASHERVIIALKNSSYREKRSIGNSLQQIKASRVWADYQLDKSFSRSESNKVLEIVKRLYNLNKL